MSIYVVGDIQGCYKPLRKLLKSVNFKPGRDELWCVGDLINRGPDSLDTLRYLCDINDSVTIVLGNHDLHFLALYHGCAGINSRHTLDNLLAAPDCGALAEWLRFQSLVHDRVLEHPEGRQHYLMVHAGVPPGWTREDTLERAAEVEDALHGKKFRNFLSNMYGNRPDCWDNSLTGYKRLRLITNYLTRMRFCKADGKLELSSKRGLDTTPDGYRPWYEFEQLTPETTILFGHWAALEGHTGKPGVYALDTGFVWGRELTMMRLEDRQLYSV